jgi:hypothetical protein
MVFKKFCNGLMLIACEFLRALSLASNYLEYCKSYGKSVNCVSRFSTNFVRNIFFAPVRT